MQGTSMYQLLCEFEFEGKPWEKHELYWDRSPIAHITAATTPMLLTHGEQVSLCMVLSVAAIAYIIIYKMVRLQAQ